MAWSHFYFTMSYNTLYKNTETSYPVVWSHFYFTISYNTLYKKTLKPPILWHEANSTSLYPKIHFIKIPKPPIVEHEATSTSIYPTMHSIKSIHASYTVAWSHFCFTISYNTLYKKHLNLLSCGMKPLLLHYILQYTL